MSEGPLTIVFTDVEASTDLRTSRGDTSAQEILRGHEQIVRELVDRHGGREVKHMGDGFMLAFTSTRKAVAWAVEVQEALHGREIRVRIGLNVGEVIDEGGDLSVRPSTRPLGSAPRRKAARSSCPTWHASWREPSRRVSFRDRGRFRLKGFPERWRLYEAAWRSEASAPVPLAERTAFVGREVELSEVLTLVDQAAGGRGGLVLLSGEAGVGKTRLADEARAHAERREMRTRIGRCYEML